MSATAGSYFGAANQYPPRPTSLLWTPIGIGKIGLTMRRRWRTSEFPRAAEG